MSALFACLIAVGVIGLGYSTYLEGYTAGLQRHAQRRRQEADRQREMLLTGLGEKGRWECSGTGQRGSQ